MHGDIEFYRETNNIVKTLLENNKGVSTQEQISKIIKVFQEDSEFSRIIMKFVLNIQNEELMYNNEDEVIKIIRKAGLKKTPSVAVEEIYNLLKKSLNPTFLDNSYSDEEKKRNEVMITWFSAVITIEIIDNIGPDKKRKSKHIKNRGEI